MFKLFSLALLPLAYAVFMRPRPSIKTTSLLNAVAETTKSAHPGGIKRWFAKLTRGNVAPISSENNDSSADLAGLLKPSKVEIV
uniref:Uncharacterized protein n=1 Tax=Panagrolaimus superbus TaxID=310955 RepID=A0A914Y6Q4_9BILA